MSKFLMILPIILFFGCCKECPNKLKKYRYGYFPYHDGQVVIFRNGKSAIRYDTVKTYYNFPRGRSSCWGGKENNELCHGWFSLSLGVFNNSFEQDGSVRFSRVDEYISLGKKSIKDTVSYNLYGQEIPAVHYQDENISYGLTEYYLSNKHELLEFSSIDSSGTTTKWILVR